MGGFSEESAATRETKERGRKGLEAVPFQVGTVKSSHQSKAEERPPVKQQGQTKGLR